MPRRLWRCLRQMWRAVGQMLDSQKYSAVLLRYNMDDIIARVLLIPYLASRMFLFAVC